MSGLASYLSMLFGAEPAGAFVETRKRLHRGGMGQDFHAVGDRARLGRLIEALGRETDLYVGVAPRSRQEGCRDAVEHVHALWADCDEPEAIAALDRFKPVPSMVVDSGRGRHAYWSLWPPATPDEAERANRRIAYALGADLRATDAARILRPPGTFNWKTGEPMPVNVERTSVAIFTVEQVAGELADPPGTRGARASTPTRLHAGDDPLVQIPPPVYIEALTGLVRDVAGKVPCPFHDDRTPSLHVYDDPERGWVCFGCGAGGTIIDLGARLYDLEPRGAGYHQIRQRIETDLRGRAAA